MINYLKIKHTNTDIKKLHTLAHNGVFSKLTVDWIVSNCDDNFIYFRSKYAYDKFKSLEYSSSALYTGGR